MATLKDEDEKSFTVTKDDGTDTRIVKTPETMAPGGAYDLVKRGSMLNNQTTFDPTMNLEEVGAPAPAPMNGPVTTMPTGDVQNAQPFVGTPTMSVAPQPKLDANGYEIKDPIATATPTPLPTTATTTPIGGDPNAPTVTSGNQAGGPPVPQGAADGGLGLTGASTAPNLVREYEGSNTLTSMGPDAEKAYKESIVADSNAIKARREADEAKDQLTLARSTAETNMLVEKNAEIQALQTARFNAEKTRQDEIDSMSAKYADMSVDTAHLWNSSSTASKIFSAIGLALGAMGQALTGQKNQTIDMIEKAINNDLDAQKANIAKYGKSIDMKRGALQDFERLGISKETARLAAYDVSMAAVQKQFEAIAASTSDKERGARAAEEGAKAADKRAAAQMQINKNNKMDGYKDVPMTAGKQPEASTDAVMEKVHSNMRGLRDLKDAVALKKKVNTGPIAAWYFAAKNKTTGLSSDEQKLRAKVFSMAFAQAKANSPGNTTKDELMIAAEQTISLMQDDDTFDAMATQAKTDMSNNLKAITAGEEGTGKRKMPVKSMMDAYGIGDSDIDFKEGK